MLVVKSLSKCVNLAFLWEARSQIVAQNSTNIHNTSLDGWMGKGEVSRLHVPRSGRPSFVLTSTIPQQTNATGVVITDKSCLIMDEVDGMSAGDRGGVGALAALIRKTKVTFFFFSKEGALLKGP